MKRLWLLLAATLGMVSSAAACSCAPPPPGTRTAWALQQWYLQRTPVVFQGKVDKIVLENFPFKPVPGKSISDIPQLRVSFSEVKFYRGESPGSVAIQTGLGGGDCGYPFEPGRSYLVFAYKDDSGALGTGICSGTRRLKNASTALRALRGDPPLPEDLQEPTGTTISGPKAENGRKICGRVKTDARAEAQATVYLWLADEVAPMFRTRDTETNPNGSFCFHDVDPGKYILAAKTEPSGSVRYVGYYPGGADRSQAAAVTISENAQTPAVDFPLVRQKLYTITGYLRGVPDALNDSINVIVMPAALDRLNVVEPAELAPHGRFEIPNVPPGHYLGYAATEDAEQGKTTFVSAGLELDVRGNMEGVRLDYATGK